MAKITFNNRLRFLRDAILCRLREAWKDLKIALNKKIRIENPAGQWFAGAGVLLVIIVVVVIACAGLFWTVGSGVYALNVGWFVDLIEDFEGNVRPAMIFFSGFSALFAIAAVGFYGFLFFRGAKNLGEQYFNSIAKKKKTKQSTIS